jgi:hypothetical protein
METAFSPSFCERLPRLLTHTDLHSSDHDDLVFDPGFQQDLTGELTATRRYRVWHEDHVSSRVKLQMIVMPADEAVRALPLTGRLMDEFAKRVRACGGFFAEWRPNLVIVHRHRPGTLGIRVHNDPIMNRFLVVVFTVCGETQFRLHNRHNWDHVVKTWPARAGGVTLMRGTGLDGSGVSCRPYHSVLGAMGGVDRITVALMMVIK